MLELEKIVEKMESRNMPLEEMISRFQRGTKLIEQCREKLKEAEQKIQILENGQLRDFGNKPASGNLDL